MLTISVPIISLNILSLMFRISRGSLSRYTFNSSICFTREEILLCPTLNPFNDRKTFILFFSLSHNFGNFDLQYGADSR